MTPSSGRPTITDSKEPPPAAISEAAMQILQDWLRERAGIELSKCDRHRCAHTIRQRMQRHGFTEFRDYLALLQSQTCGTELNAIREIIEPEPIGFQYFNEIPSVELLNALNNSVATRADNDPIRIWCLPAGIGALPYSLAITLLEQWQHSGTTDIEIIASDARAAHIDSCRSGLYSADAIAALPAAIQEKYFKRNTGQFYQFHHNLVKLFEFNLLNLDDTDQTRRYRNFDAILCPQLFPSLSPKNRRYVANLFYDALRPNGKLFLSPSESLGQISSLFSVKRRVNSIVYEKPCLEAISS